MSGATTPASRMVTPAEAERLARDAVQNYANACNLQTTEDAGNALMKLVSVAGITMSALVGADEAAARLEGTAEFVRRNGQNMKMERTQ
ncbi:hypothetical protein [Variovorax sp. LT1R16]|uniref:hypothetical protein n=1 Tax=Variovorax sp. LT1R16 TaxID=3443728 RepID=UPI003F4811E7